MMSSPCVGSLKVGLAAGREAADKNGQLPWEWAKVNGHKEAVAALKP